jgi:hypothetical protein
MIVLETLKTYGRNLPYADRATMDMFKSATSNRRDKAWWINGDPSLERRQDSREECHYRKAEPGATKWISHKKRRQKR